MNIEVLQAFEKLIEQAELSALSKLSLNHILTDKQLNRYKELMFKI